MQENYAFIADAIDTRCQTFTDIADDIWDHPETRFEEFWSAERLASALEAEGFTLTREAGDSQRLYCQLRQRQARYRPSGRIRCPGRAKPAGTLRDGAIRHPGGERPRLRA